VVSRESSCTAVLVKNPCARFANLMLSLDLVFVGTICQKVNCVQTSKSLFVQLCFQLLFLIDCSLCLTPRMVLKYMEDVEDFVENVFLTPLLVSNFKYSENCDVVRASKQGHLPFRCKL